MSNISDIMAGTSKRKSSWWTQLKYILSVKLVTLITKRNPVQERVVRFFTNTSKTVYEHYFDCPRYYLDTLSEGKRYYVFQSFIKACYKISSKLPKIFPTYGEYWYDIAVTLNKQDGSYNWTILKSNNPRCVFGDLNQSKNCKALTHPCSQIEISGHSLNGKYKKFVDLLSALSHRVVILHHRRDMIALFKVLKFIGITQISYGGRIFPNTPTTWKNLGFTHGYYIDSYNGQLTAISLNRTNLPTNPQSLIDIGEIIIKRNARAYLSDLIY